jgi:hypothetical protein
MTAIKILQALFGLMAGALLIGYGGMDDSPGAQGIGLLTVIGSIVVLITMFRARPRGIK